jgi:hypothetical protein
MVFGLGTQRGSQNGSRPCLPKMQAQKAVFITAARELLVKLAPLIPILS